MIGLTRRRCAGEEGAVLILTLAFLAFAGVIVVALLNFTTASLEATSKLALTRGTDYDADGAVQAAIATIRVNALAGFVGSPCPSYTPPAATLNNPSLPVRVDCTPKVVPPLPREVVLSVCLTSVAAPCPDAQSLLRADVKFYDLVSLGRAVAIQTWSTAP